VKKLPASVGDRVARQAVRSHQLSEAADFNLAGAQLRFNPQ
jgi:hypothetical protein